MLQRERAAKAPRGIARLHAVAIDEHLAVAGVAEQGAAQRANLGRRVDPAGGLGVELAQLLQGALLFFHQQPDAHLGRPSTALPCGLFSLRASQAEPS